MRFFTKVLVIAIMTVALAGASFSAKKGRKLNVGAYLKSAKIGILSGDLKRYPDAISMLDSLFMHYGPHAEGLNLMAQVNIDYMEKTPDPWEKRAYLDKMVAYFDSLRMCKENPDVKKKYKKDIDKTIEKADSTEALYWRQYYNAGIEQFTFVQDLAIDLETASDSTDSAFISTGMDANIDSCIINMELAIAIDPVKPAPYIATGAAYDEKKDYRNAIEWYAKGLDVVPTPDSLLLPIAYDYIHLEDYCGSIPYFTQYIEIQPNDTLTMGNLAVCHNNCKQYEEAVGVYHKILAINPNSTLALTNVGRYFNQQARFASDSSAAYEEAGNEEQKKFWFAKRKEAFDSSSVYLKISFENQQDNSAAAEEYGVVCAIRGDYENAAIAFSRLSVLEPENVGNWTYLGDCYLNLQDFDQAIPAYQKVVELEPDNKATWQRLGDLYSETGAKTEAAAAYKKSK